MKYLAFASALFFATTALADPPPWAGGPGGPNAGSDFSSWADGSIMSGSANDFSFKGSFDELGVSLGGMSAEGWNKGEAGAHVSFDGHSFDGDVHSENFGGIDVISGGFGAGLDHRMDFDASSFGQSFGEVEWGFGD